MKLCQFPEAFLQLDEKLNIIHRTKEIFTCKYANEALFCDSRGPSSSLPFSLRYCGAVIIPRTLRSNYFRCLFSLLIKPKHLGCRKTGFEL